MVDSGFSRPPLTDLITRNEADINTRLAGADSRIRRSVLSVLARMNAGNTHTVYGYLDWIAKQVFPDSAEAENLERWAAIFGITRKPATKATGSVTLTGVNGSAINVGTVFMRGDGAEFETTAAAAIASGTATVPVQAREAGDTGNTTDATAMSFISPISGIQASLTSGELAGGTDTESDDSLRVRLLARLRKPPQGGSQTDYEQWALEVPGVTRVFVSPQEAGIGTVTVRFMMDETYDDGIPASGDVDIVQAYLETKRPVTAEVFAVAPTAVALDFTIQLKKSNGTTETSPAIQNAVAAELADMIVRDAIPGGKILISHIREAISVAAGEHDHIVTVPAADVTHAAGEIAVMGAITWQA